MSSQLAGVRHHPAHVWALPRHRLGWSVQRPRRRAAERDQDAIDRARTWAPRGQPPTLTHPFNDTDSLIEVLGELRVFLGGEKATLRWDGLPEYAPELNRSRACGPASRPSSWPT